ncbi:MAG: cyclic lactone autoinducer peptide [Lachnospiraceae bacterium]|nr:cyclic lactone autoinducer peptide [Lachnospiraceae bacterium]
MNNTNFHKQTCSAHLCTHFLTALAFLANLSAQLGAGTASSWNKYQPTLPKDLRR